MIERMRPLFDLLTLAPKHDHTFNERRAVRIGDRLVSRGFRILLSHVIDGHQTTIKSLILMAPKEANGIGWRVLRVMTREAFRPASGHSLPSHERVLLDVFRMAYPAASVSGFIVIADDALLTPAALVQRSTSWPRGPIHRDLTDRELSAA
jgi:hypothetical protein